MRFGPAGAGLVGVGLPPPGVVTVGDVVGDGLPDRTVVVVVGIGVPGAGTVPVVGSGVRYWKASFRVTADPPAITSERAMALLAEGSRIFAETLDREQTQDLPDTASTAARFAWGNQPDNEDPCNTGARRFHGRVQRHRRVESG